MKLALHFSALMTALFFTACASPAPDRVADASSTAKEECETTLGSRICRKPGSGNVSSVKSVSGDDLRRRGGPLTGPQPGRIGD
jgi:hypothetical protein